LATAWDGPAEQLWCHFGVISLVTVIEKESGMGESEFVGRGLGVGAGHPEGAGGVSGIGRCYSYAGDSLNVGDRRVTEPVGADAKLGSPVQMLDALGKALEPFVVEVTPIHAMQYGPAAVMATSGMREEALHQVRRYRHPSLLGVFLNEAHCSRRRGQVVLPEPDGTLSAASRLPQEPENKVVKFGIP
jgi:hypothetical protein